MEEKGGWWWAKAYRFANFSLGGPDLRRVFQTRIALYAPGPLYHWEDSSEYTCSDSL